MTNKDTFPHVVGTLLKFSSDQPSAVINPFASFTLEPFELLSLIEAATGFDLNQVQRNHAVEAGLLVAQRTTPNAALLVEEWIKHPDLADFAREARRALIPG
ncbi:hypothetical protein [Pseudomonas sp. AP19]|uniref:hypothetical protein n=1 Tax=Pseudomonas TaxID=286 RepID=UPI00114C913F|nr:hypothetical protein [Pseudomonas sp. AP19]